ncbi:MAG: methylmalonyl-CoA epimerase [Desulfobulbaceae bacterium]|nr:methylmalonyl-CoA epimerase [Desulfobulbaceae bacterium]
MLEKIDHIGIAVKSIEAARTFYEDVLGLTLEKVETVKSQKVKTAFFRLGELHIELLEPTDDSSPIAGFLAKKGEGIHHIAYKTDNIADQLEKARSSGCKLIHETPVPGAGGKEVAFLHPKSSFGVLTEFCAKKG